MSQWDMQDSDSFVDRFHRMVLYLDTSSFDVARILCYTVFFIFFMLHGDYVNNVGYLSLKQDDVSVT
jgi:hypothetical protein